MFVETTIASCLLRKEPSVKSSDCEINFSSSNNYIQYPYSFNTSINTCLSNESHRSILEEQRKVLRVKKKGARVKGLRVKDSFEGRE